LTSFTGRLALNGKFTSEPDQIKDGDFVGAVFRPRMVYPVFFPFADAGASRMPAGAKSRFGGRKNAG